MGRDFHLEIRGAGGNRQLIPGLINNLVQMPVDLIVTTADPVAIAAKAATTTIPILMAVNGDPVVAGLVTSIARPGGNITGLMLPQVAGKRLELLRDLVPGLQRVAAMHAPAAASTPFVMKWLQESQAGAQQLGLQLQVAPVQGPNYDSAFAQLRQAGVGGVSVVESPQYGRTGLRSRRWRSSTGCRWSSPIASTSMSAG
jgi:ABC-type uncharacterized transport system substrate-binding protein